jgi:hypothetical protein
MLFDTHDTHDTHKRHALQSMTPIGEDAYAQAIVSSVELPRKRSSRN